MKEQNSNKPNKLLLLYLSWFGTGYSPKAPGTVGSLATLPFLYLLHLNAPSILLLVILIVVLTVLACWAADIVQKQMGLQDPQWIVIDEVIGMLITWTIVRPQTYLEWALVFGAFRFFDIVKIWPASFFDEKVKNGAGTIVDDVISGLYAGFFVYYLSVFFLRY